MKKIAFFDFDGTITKKDTLLEFIKFSSGRFNFFLGFLLNSPSLLAYKLKFISNQTAKEKVLRFFFRDMPLRKFQELCDRFADQKLPALIRPKALEEIEKLKKAQITVVIVSASPENWIRKWATMKQLELISTRLEIQDDRLTGKILGHNCHGKEKVNRITENYVLSDYSEIYAYGDSAGDKPMLALASIHFMKPFR